MSFCPSSSFHPLQCVAKLTKHWINLTMSYYSVLSSTVEMTGAKALCSLWENWFNVCSLILPQIFLKKNQLSHCGAVVPHVLQVENHFRKAGYHNIHCFYQNKGNSRVKKLHIRIWLIFRARKIMSIKQQILFYITIFWKCTCCVKNLLKGCVLQMFYKLQKSFGLWLQNMIQFYLATQE